MKKSDNYIILDSLLRSWKQVTYNLLAKKIKWKLSKKINDLQKLGVRFSREFTPTWWKMLKLVSIPLNIKLNQRTWKVVNTTITKRIRNIKNDNIEEVIFKEISIFQKIKFYILNLFKKWK